MNMYQRKMLSSLEIKMTEQFKNWYADMYEKTGDPNYHQAAYGHAPGKDLSKYLVESE